MIYGIAIAIIFLIAVIGLALRGIDAPLPPPIGDTKYLTDIERLGVQTAGDAEIARRIIEERKANQVK